MAKKKRTCSICRQRFYSTDLFPNAFIRDGLFKEITGECQDFKRDGYICYRDYSKYNAKYYERILRKEKGRLSNLEKEVIESLKGHEFISENINLQFEKKLTFGERLSDKLALFGGSWLFVVSFFILICFWMVLNLYIISNAFDPYPFILLNLILSCLAAVQAPVILMSQNRQAAKDRLQSEQDYLVNLNAELQIRQLNSKFDVFMRHHLEIMNDIISSQEDLQEQLERREIGRGKNIPSD